MAGSILEQYRIADLLNWYNHKQLVPNPEFQRRNVWTLTAKVFLIDTILRELPIPKIYIRTKVDLVTQKSYRELVDGQQRIKAIIEFAQDKFALTDRASEFSGETYSSLSEEQKRIFLSYPIGVSQLINASDTEVLEVFARLNSYTINLNSAELRHAKFQGPFRWAVHELAKKWEILWEKYAVVSVRERLRMGDDSLMAEMFGIILNGVTDGGQPKITRLYSTYDKAFTQQKEVEEKVSSTLSYIVQNLEDAILGTPLARAPHFLMLFAAVAHALHGIPKGDLQEHPQRNPDALRDVQLAVENLTLLANVISSSGFIDSGDIMHEFEMHDFATASASTTHRIKSRALRFPYYYKALLPARL